MPDDNTPRRAGPAWLAPALCVLSLAAAAVYGLTPFTYSYFQNVPYFSYFPTRIGAALRRSTAAVGYERAWGLEQRVPFKGGDLTCQLQPRATAADCARPLAPKATVYGPYLVLPAGDYSVAFDIGAPKDCASPVHVDVFAGQFDRAPLAQGTFPASQNRAQLRFTVDDAYAGRAKLEFRTVLEGGRPCAVLKRVNLVRLHP